MRRVFILCFFSTFCIPIMISQNENMDVCGHFTKRIEYNLIALFDSYNLESKGVIEKMLLRDFNAPIEFFYAPSFEGASAFRIVRDSLKTYYILEVRYISNYEEARKEAAKDDKSIGLSGSSILSTTDDVKQLIIEHNRKEFAKIHEEYLKRIIVKTISFRISDPFAEKIYNNMVSIIDNFKGRGVPPLIMDGYSVTFRTVVEDEVWSLNIHMPNGNALKISDLCRQIITDALAGKLDEEKYVSELDSFEK